MEECDDLKIPLEDVILATNNFAHNKRIGWGGFGTVYIGELSRPEGLITVACKRLDPKSGQGDVEFQNEIRILSKYKHENLVTLLHFCIEGDERILVYEYAARGSLDCYLSYPSLTWTQRLKICVGVAHALNYLHDPKDTQHRIIHRDIKSANILLDEEWNAKVSDFGLSKFGPANQPQSYVITNVAGTPGYLDPSQLKTRKLSKEFDVYSFGVMLFEVMCGKLCCEYDQGKRIRVFVPEWKRCSKEKKLNDIVCHGLEEHMEPESLITFSTIAYRCLEEDPENRPKMAEIVQKLKIALEQQEDLDNINFEELQRIADLAVPPLSYKTRSQLHSLLMEGVLVDNGKTWLSVNKKGQHCELIAAHKCMPPSMHILYPREIPVSRFQYKVGYLLCLGLRLKVKTQFLSPNVTYTINLVYKCNRPLQHNLRIPFKYKLEEMSEYSKSCVAHVGEHGWLRTELFQFTSTKKKHNFDIHFLSEMKGWKSVHLSIEGVEFCPVDFEQDENKVDVQPPDDLDWEERLPDDYTKIVKNIDESMTQKEIYLLLRKGVYINKSQQWFSISKKSKQRLMLPARTILTEEKSGCYFLSPRKSWLWKALPGSRFNEVAEACEKNHIVIRAQIESQLLSHDTMYACYLVFKLPENASVFEGIVITGFKGHFSLAEATKHYTYLVAPPHTPVIELCPGEKAARTRKIKGHPKLRKDGWMEIPVWEFQLDSNFGYSFCIDGYLKSFDKWNFTGLLIQGIEFRPAKVFM